MTSTQEEVVSMELTIPPMTAEDPDIEDDDAPPSKKRREPLPRAQRRQETSIPPELIPLRDARVKALLPLHPNLDAHTLELAVNYHIRTDENAVWELVKECDRQRDLGLWFSGVNSQNPVASES